jgi:carbon storage regulator CsrA
MLVLSRRPQQKVVFPSVGISVEILSVQGHNVRVGVEAPRDVAVWRDEILPCEAPQADVPSPHPRCDSRPGGPTPKARLARAAAAARRRLTALLVEDNRNECTLLASYLRLNGIAVETADDGVDALEYLEGHERPDVVLLDMHLPRFDGPSTVAAIRRNPRFEGLKVFAVTGASQAEYGIPIGPAGVDRWFTKPINPPGLIDEMSGLVTST